MTPIINEMFAHSEFPEELKIAEVSPVYKGGGEQELNNYRPISALPLFSKRVERVIYDRLTSFFRKHNIITKSQYGFQKDRSAEQALIKINEKIIGNIENKLLTQGIFLGLKKAFDTVQHDILLEKIAAMVFDV